MTREREARRQQRLLQALWNGGPLDEPTQDAPQRQERALSAYRAGAHAAADRALAAAYPTVRAILGEDSFTQLAGALWHARPPVHGDLAAFGDTLPDFIADSEQLTDVPYLADVARVDWAVHRAAAAADDAPVSAEALGALAADDPSRVHLVLRAGSAVFRSAHPVVTIHAAHREGAFGAARDALAAGRGENALVVRRGWAVDVLPLSDADARFTGALLRASLGAALEGAGADFHFDDWLLRALRGGWLAGVRPAPTESEPR